MDLAGRDWRSCICAMFILGLLSTVLCTPFDQSVDCFEACKDIDNETEKEECVLKNCPHLDVKRSPGGFVRIGKSEGEDASMETYPDENKRSASNFVRIGKGSPSSFVRIGRAGRNGFVRIGKAFPRYFLRMIKGNPSSFVRIGRSNPGSFVRIGKASPSSFVRIGKSLEDGDTEDLEEQKRMGGFVRIGKGNPGSFVRIGKASPGSFVRIGKASPGSFVRIGKASPSGFVRIGKSPELDEDGSLDEDDLPTTVVKTRNDPNRFLRLG